MSETITITATDADGNAIDSMTLTVSADVSLTVESEGN